MVDALCSGRSVRKDVLVRIQSWAQCPFSKAERAFLFLSGQARLPKRKIKMTESAEGGKGHWDPPQDNMDH